MSRQLSFTDYEGFCEKFKPKKTTDDCYTPPDVASLPRDAPTPELRRAAVPYRPLTPGPSFGAAFFVGENYNNYTIGVKK